MVTLRNKGKHKLRVAFLCRGEGMGYVVLAGNSEFDGLEVAAATKDGLSVPCEVYPVVSLGMRRLLEPGAKNVWVVTLPLLSCDCTLKAHVEGTEHASIHFPALGSKVASRVLSTTKPQAAAVLRGYERTHGHGRTMVRIAEVWPARSGEVVWRMRVEFPTNDAAPAPSLRVFDARARELQVASLVMEDQITPSPHDSTRLVRLVTFSCRLPEELGSFFVVADLAGREGAAGFDGMNAPRAAGLIHGARMLARGASGNPAYTQWFEGHRATDAELARQRESCASLPEQGHPLISLVMPVCRTPRPSLCAALGSVVAQSYDRWELVVVNASGTCAEVNEALATHADARIRVLEVPNRSISENVNAGIEAANGSYVGFVDPNDVLEPDALWCFASALRSHPKADLLYSDEDRLGREGVYAPSFKTFPNYGRLYTHNYIGHLLMISRWALDHTERSGPNVAGAQDYDLALRVFEVARDVVHVPRVLCHARECEEAALGGEGEKPFAHVAGARALQAHLERRGIVAQVEDGVLPCTYRVRYQLPDPAQKVSIVIPTRDQANLLRTCVESILDKSTYPNYEVVLVENNSVDDRTFALYEELCKDARVRVVTWRPEVAGTFNYSEIVNYGVSRSSGDLIVLLNNDTEVVEPSWMEEMAGCLMRPEVGVVGAKLLFGDGLIQHVGMVGNPEGYFCHVCQNLTKDALGPAYAAAMPGDYSMVTGACQMTRRMLFNELGGYDPHFAVGYNDGDFCLRAREAGYAVTVCAHALLHHREFSTRGRESTDARLRERHLKERARMMGRHAEFFAQGDPALNPNLDPFGAYFDIVWHHETT